MLLNTLTAAALEANHLQNRTDPRIYREGMALYWNGRARVMNVGRQSATMSVLDRRSINAQVEFRLVDGKVQITCSHDPSDGTAGPTCVHRIAATMKLTDYLRYNPIETWETVLNQALEKSPRRTAAAPQRTLLALSLQKPYSTWTIVPYALPITRIPEAFHQDREAIAGFVRRDHLGANARPIRSSARRFVNVTPEQARAVEMLLLSHTSYLYEDDASILFGSIVPDLRDLPFFYGTESSPFQRLLTIYTEPARPELTVETVPEGRRVVATVEMGGRTLCLAPGEVPVVCKDPLWILAEDALIPVEATAEAASLLAMPPVTIPPEEEALFLDNYLAPLAARLPVRGEGIEWEEIAAAPEPRVYLSETEEGELKAVLAFGYGEWEAPFERNPPPVAVGRKPNSTTLLRVNRDAEVERAAWEALSSYGLKRGTEPGEFRLRAKTHVVDFLLHEVPRLAEAGYTVFGEEALTTARVNRNRPTLSFNVSSGIDWFDVGAVVNFGELTVNLKDIRRAVRKRERFIKLADGTIGVLPPEWLEKYRRLFGAAQETEEGLRLSQAQVTLLDQVLGEADRFQADAEYERRRQRLRDFSSIAKHDPPRGLGGEMRPYQKAGFDWLHFLHEYHFGGCLADDMGLGKTFEALAFLLSLRESGHATAPDLIVMPRSLLFNWQREAAKFTPGLKLLLHADKDRTRELDELDQYDLVLTTYGLMLRDIEHLRHKRFHYAVLDESQAIKNPLSQTARAARLLNADHRLVLTGTPVENSTTELWSQFAFLNPGLLGNLEYFREEFVNPIERRQDAESAEFLRKMVYPFVLRRTKDQVAPELPPRTERVLVTDMEPAQRKLYEKWRDYYRAQVLGLLDEEGMNNARMKVLEGLLRLRQICNDPRTVDKRYKGGSGKFDLLLETLETIQSEGHKALVFSQFVQMLSLVREALDERGVPYTYLDGKTKDRQSVVDTFQGRPDIPFFLVSLKAGGVGLNLTAADYVVHIDPWWNPAVEMQAADRTHRIGQDKPVFIYKLIVRESVEEKILQLQERKRGLVSRLISTESGFFKSLTREDVEVLFT